MTISPSACPPRTLLPLALEHERGAEDAEDRARGADGDRVRAQEQRPGRAGEPRDEVEREEAPAADRLLDRRADDPETNMFIPEVDQARVEEGSGDQAVPLALVEPARM